MHSIAPKFCSTWFSLHVCTRQYLTLALTCSTRQHNREMVKRKWNQLVQQHDIDLTIEDDVFFGKQPTSEDVSAAARKTCLYRNRNFIPKKHARSLLSVVQRKHFRIDQNHTSTDANIIDVTEDEVHDNRIQSHSNSVSSSDSDTVVNIVASESPVRQAEHFALQVHFINETHRPILIALSKAILAFNSPPPLRTCRNRQIALEDLRRVARGFGNTKRNNHYQEKLELIHIGSTASGLCSDLSDVDVTLMTENSTNSHNDVRLLRSFRNLMLRRIFGMVQLIPGRIPLLRCVHQSTGISLDISVNAHEASASVHVQHLATKRWPMLRSLTLAVKQLLGNHSLADAVTGGLKGYCVSLMLMHVLAYFDNNAHVPDWLSHDELAGFIFVCFLEYFGNQFDAFKHALRVNSACDTNLELRTDSPDTLNLVIWDPTAKELNAARACRSFKEIQMIFKSALDCLFPDIPVRDGKSAAVASTVLNSQFMQVSVLQQQIHRVKRKKQKKTSTKAIRSNNTAD